MSVTLRRPRAGLGPGARVLSRRSRRSPLALWHLLSLDAPSIAALWTWFIAASSRVDLPAGAVVAMFLAVWVLYIGDRLLDARRLSAQPLEGAATFGSGFEERHFFHARHRTALLRVAAVAAFALALSLNVITPEAIRLYAVLGSLLALYFLVIHALDGERRLPKELAVGSFFSAAVFIPTVARRPDLQSHLLPLALLFAALCSVNCLRILAWEQPTPPGRPRLALALLPGEGPQRLHWVTRAALRLLAPLHLGLTLAALVLAIAARSPVAFAIALSGTLLWLLHGCRHRLTRVHLRAAADLALAAPLPVALLAGVWR